MDIEDPHDARSTIASLVIRDAAVATSGINRRRWKVGGEIVHHLVDPRTGRSANTDLAQVTVVAGRAEDAEVIAKVVVLLGAARGRSCSADSTMWLQSSLGSTERSRGLAAERSKMRKPIVCGILVIGLLLVIADAFATRAHLVPSVLPRPDGPWCWISARAMGIVAYLVLSTNVVLGLLLSTRRGDRLIGRGQSVEVHQWLSGATLGLVAAHALLLLGDGFIRFDALDVLVPFIDPYRSVAVGLGVLGAYVAFLIHWTFSLRRVIGVAMWRRLHYLTFLLLVFATPHGVLAGTDSRSMWVAAMYRTAGGSVFVLVVCRLPPIARLSRSGSGVLAGSA